MNYLNLLTVLGEINEPYTVAIGAVVVGVIGRNDGLRRADDTSAARRSVADVETHPRHHWIRLIIIRKHHIST